jgi:hypothetical protein
MSKVLLAAAFGLFATAAVNAQNSTRETIEGNGKVVTRDVSVTSFDALKASGVYELKLSQGDKEAVRIEADENLQQYFNVHNEGNALVFDMKDLKNKNLKNKSTLRVYVTFKKLKEMDLSTVGSVNTEKELKVKDNMMSRVKNKGAAPMRKNNKVMI